MIWLLRLCLISLLGCGMTNAEGPPTSIPVSFYKKFSDGRHFYRLLTIDEKSNSLYVGAMNRMYRLWIFNVNDTANTETFAQHISEPSDQNRANCVYRSREPQFQCQNHFRVILRRRDGLLYVCGTNAFTPQVSLLDVGGLTLKERKTGITGAAICAHNPDDNATAVWVEAGNPSDISSIYSATVTDYSQANRIIYRPPLVDANGQERFPYMKTLDSDSNWLNEPQFVGSFEIGQYVYFFLREVASEMGNCGGAVYSRVARLCKNDKGGQHVLLKNWTTFLKARITCSIPGETPFHFNHIQSIVKSEQNGQIRFYGTFQTPSTGYSGSAVCSFTLKDIDNVLDYGTFKEQVPSCPAWLPVSPGQVPTPRPGQCTQDSLTKSDDVLHFTKSHLLMDDVVKARLVYDIRDRMLGELVVDTVDRTDSEVQFRVVFAAADDNTVYKVAEWQQSDGKFDSRLLAIYDLPVSEPIRAMQLLKNEFLYVGVDEFVGQLVVSQCERYTSCVGCTSDAYCAWNTQKKQCVRMNERHPYSAGWLVNAPNGHADCNVIQPSADAVTQKLVYPGDTLYLECPDAATSSHVWHKDGRPVTTDSRRKLATDMSMIVLNASAADAGMYECKYRSETMLKFNVQVDEVNCQQPSNIQAFKSVYREWCREFHTYKNTMTKWQEWYEQNSQCSSAPNFKKLMDGNKLQLLKDSSKYS